MYGLLTKSGCEALSNDRASKIILRQITFLDVDSNMSGMIYVSYVFTKDKENTWEKSISEAENYSSITQFLERIRNVPCFTHAYEELSNLIKNRAIHV